MPANSTSWTAERGRVAALSRSRRPDDPDLLAARAALKAARAALPDGSAMSDGDRIAEHIRALVDMAPPLTEAQRQRLAAIINGGRDA